MRGEQGQKACSAIWWNGEGCRADVIQASESLMIQQIKSTSSGIQVFIHAILFIHAIFQGWSFTPEYSHMHVQIFINRDIYHSHHFILVLTKASFLYLLHAFACTVWSYSVQLATLVRPTDFCPPCKAMIDSVFSSSHCTYPTVVSISIPFSLKPLA